MSEPSKSEPGTIDGPVRRAAPKAPRLPPPLPTLLIRDLEAGDINFILNSWLESYKPYVVGHRNLKGTGAAITNGPRRIHPEVYYKSQQRLIAALSNVREVKILYDKDLKDYIVGWICGKRDEESHQLVVDYCYVKHTYRARKAGRQLMLALGWKPGERIIATHWTASVNNFWFRHNIEYDDYRVKLGAF